MKRIIGHFLPFSFVIIYAVIPLLVFEFSSVSMSLAGLTVLSCTIYLFGYYSKSRRIATKRRISFEQVLNISLSIYFISFLVLFVTADNVPLISSLRGTDPDLLALYREDFVKNRTGIEGVFRYTYTIFGGSLVPILLVVGLDRKPKRNKVFILLYFLTSIVVLAKANFLRIGIPLFLRYLYHSHNKLKLFFKGLFIIVCLLIMMYRLAGDRNEVVRESGDFWSAYYFTPELPKLISWRIISIPVVTARDWLMVFENDFNGEFLYGRTSGFLAFVFQETKINFEKIIFKYQWGGEGNSNAFYVMEAFINFGYLGVIIISFVVGKLIRFVLTNELFGTVTVPLFVFFLFNTGFIGTMLSNGYLLLFLIFNFINHDKVISNNK